MDSMPQQASALFRLHLSSQQVVEIPLPLDQPVYLLINELSSHYQLAAVEGGYALFAGSERRLLSREVPLARTAYAGGGELYLAPRHAPWWAAQPATPVAAAATGAARPPTRSLAVRPQRRLDRKSVVLGLLGLLTLGLLGLLFWPQTTPELTDTPSNQTLLAPTAARIEATATLLPATPTPDPVTQARQNYQQGLRAYEGENWPVAAEYFQQVYAYASDYEGVQSALAATHYNWGVQMLNQGTPDEALSHFETALAVDSEHALAHADQQKATLLLEAQRLAVQGEPQAAIERYRELRTLQGGDYAGATGQLYELLLARASGLAEQGGDSNLRAAYNLYREAAALDLADVSQAREGLATIEPLLPRPTATPKPTAVPQPARLRFSVANYNDDPRCISIKITGIVPSGWYFSVDGLRGINGRFDGGGNARACGLGPGQEVTISVIDGNGSLVAGGAGVPSKGSAIMVASWK